MGRTQRRTSWLAGVVPVAGVTAAALVATAAVSGGAPAYAASRLPEFTDCAQLRDWYARATLPHVTPWGLERLPTLVFAAGGVVGEPRRTAGVALAQAGSSPTGTNVQEAGVDEPDVAKTDGRRVVLVDQGVLRVFDVTGSEPREMASLALPAGVEARKLLLAGDSAILLGGKDREASVTTIDLSDSAAPRVVRTESIEGRVLSARMHNGTVRIVVATTPDLDFVHPSKRLTRSEALGENRRIVRSAGVEAWLPNRTSGGRSTPLLDCRDVRHPTRPAGAGTISVLTVDPRAPGRLAATGVAADGDRVYSSTDRLYVATTTGGWDLWQPRRLPAPGFERASSTQIHAFDVSGARTAYVASGRVPGLVKDRWSFSEHAGHLRVATTLGGLWSPRATVVRVLAERDGRLVAVGAVGGIGKGEEVKAVRWFGDVAVIVTFRQVDPLYTLDLSDPRRPRVAGELKIPGFSAYLHPVGGRLLLGVGQDASRRGWTRGAQLSTFDLGDLADPRRVDTAGLGRHSRSPVGSNPHTFSYLPDRRLALLPVTGWAGPRLVVVRVGADGTLRHWHRVRLAGPVGSVRALPLGDSRVAVVSGGAVVDLLTTAMR